MCPRLREGVKCHRSAYPIRVDVALHVCNAVLLNPLELFVEEFLGSLQYRTSRAVGPSFVQCETDELQSFQGVADTSPWQLVPGGEIPSRESMVVLDDDRSGHGSRQMPHIRNQASIERHQQRPSSVVGGRIGQVERPKNRQRGLAAAGGAKHHRMAGGGER